MSTSQTVKTVESQNQSGVQFLPAPLSTSKSGWFSHFEGQSPSLWWGYSPVRWFTRLCPTLETSDTDGGQLFYAGLKRRRRLIAPQRLSGSGFGEKVVAKRRLQLSSLWHRQVDSDHQCQRRGQWSRSSRSDCAWQSKNRPVHGDAGEHRTWWQHPADAASFLFFSFNGCEWTVSRLT